MTESSDVVRSAIVTGAGSGIGRAVAVALAGSGYSVALLGRRVEALRETADLCGEADVVTILPCDVADAGQLSEAIKSVHERHGRIDVLVNCAGVARVRPIARTTPDVVSEALATNAGAIANAIHCVWPIITRQEPDANGRRGVIVNISSMAAIDPYPGFFAYAASKAAANMLSVVADREGKRAGVRCFCLCPGAVETAMLRSSFDEKTVPRERALSPDDVAAVVMQCVRGERDGEAGGAIEVVKSSSGAKPEASA